MIYYAPFPGAWWNGRHAGFRFQFRKEWGFKSPHAHHEAAANAASTIWQSMPVSVKNV